MALFVTISICTSRKSLYNIDGRNIAKRRVKKLNLNGKIELIVFYQLHCSIKLTSYKRFYVLIPQMNLFDCTIRERIPIQASINLKLIKFHFSTTPLRNRIHISAALRNLLHTSTPPQQEHDKTENFYRKKRHVEAIPF